MKKKLAILGSTGSIGTQALQVVEEHNELFEIEVLTANNNVDLLIQQAIKFNPNVVVVANDKHYSKVFDALDPLDIHVYAGKKAVEQVVEAENIDMVLMAIVGFDGLKPTLAALENKKPVALANKESLVVGGHLVSEAALRNITRIIPVDSEHSAIFQCLMGELNNPIHKIVLTASGGPFLGYTHDQLKNVSVADTLAHPNWNMGNKVTVDSATLMNKGLEAIEAKWLFDLNPEQIDVVVHPQSIIHSMVYFEDSSVKAQLSMPDMRLPIQFALSYPNRLKNSLEQLDLMKINRLDFDQPDTKNFSNLALAFEAMKMGGNMPCILNASNELAVDAFLRNEIGFNDISKVVELTLEYSDFVSKPELDDLFNTNDMARRKAGEIVKKLK